MGDGLVHVYDLNMNRNEHICYQKVVKRAKLTHVAFNPVNPILNVGDDRGGVNCLKLSPNLRGKLARFRLATSTHTKARRKTRSGSSAWSICWRWSRKRARRPRRRNAAPVESILALAGLPSFVALFSLPRGHAR